MKKSVAIAALSLLLIGLFFSLSIHKSKVLVVEDKTSGVYKEYVTDGTFVLGYIHSVLLTPADEYFEITDDNKLSLQKTIYESFGVGLPYEQINDSDFEIVDGKFILYIQREMDELNMLISPIPDHTLTIGDEKIHLYELTNENIDSIKLYAKEEYVLKIWNHNIIL